MSQISNHSVKITAREKRAGRRKTRRLPWEGALAIAVLLGGWMWGSHYSTPMFFPSLTQIFTNIVTLLSSPEGWSSIGTTYARILLYLAGSFVISSLLGLLAAWNVHIERFLLPLIELKQGIPALCWVLFAIIWFADSEARIAFVVITSALPTFFYQSRDALRSIPRDWVELVHSLRPSAWQKARILWWPAILPALLTGWRINIGNATRVTIMAELLGGITGIGHELRVSQEMFRMDQTIAWTAVLVLFVIASNAVISLAERHYLFYRHGDGVRDHVN